MSSSAILQIALLQGTLSALVHAIFGTFPVMILPFDRTKKLMLNNCACFATYVRNLSDNDTKAEKRGNIKGYMSFAWPLARRFGVNLPGVNPSKV